LPGGQTGHDDVSRALDVAQRWSGFRRRCSVKVALKGQPPLKELAEFGPDPNKLRKLG
jgi:hypothetical protein